MKTALILIDIQNDYFKGGRAELYHTIEAAEKAKIVLEHFREKNLPIFHVQHVDISRKAGFFQPDTKGIEIYREMAPIPGEKIIVKHRPNAFYGTTLDQDLKSLGIEHVVICGMMSHMCIDTSVRAASDLNYKVSLVKDTCTTMDLPFEGKIIKATIIHEAAMASLNGVFAEEYNAEEIIKIIE